MTFSTIVILTITLLQFYYKHVVICGMQSALNQTLPIKTLHAFMHSFYLIYKYKTLYSYISFSIFFATSYVTNKFKTLHSCISFSVLHVAVNFFIMSLHEGTITAISVSPSVEYKALN